MGSTRTRLEGIRSSTVPSRSPSSHERQPWFQVDRQAAARHVQLRCLLSNWRVLEPLSPNLAPARSDENERLVRSM